MSADKTGNYIVDHWYGRHGFAWSFWFNLVLLRILVFLAQDWWSPAKGSDYSAHYALVIALAIFFHGFFFVWQLAGVLRAYEAYIRAKGSMGNVWGAQLGALIASWFTAIYALNSWQMTLPVADDKNFQARLEAERAGKYSIVPSADGLTLALTGSIEMGISQQLATKLTQNPNVRTIILTSLGGNIYEARGLSKIIREKGLDTLVESQCSSSCTTVFIGGITRRLMPNARLGFHQYWIDATYMVLNADPSAEQERDRVLFAASNVKPWFLTRMFESSSNEMWFPEIEDLLDAGVVTHRFRPI